MDCIKIEELKIYGNHGVFDFEKENGQNFYVNAKVYTNTQLAGLTDDLNKSVSYVDVIEDIVDIVKNNTFDLIETVAENIAIAILNKYSLVQEVSVQVRKPEAPIDHAFASVSVTVNRKRHMAFVAYGSNMGDSEKIIGEGLKELDAHNCISVKKDSGIIRSSAYGVTDQQDFYNGVVMLETYLEPEVLLDELNRIEASHNRVRDVHWGPRTLDLDIIMYDDLVINSERLTIPHRDMKNRDFVLTPMAKIAGDVIHPVTKMTIADMAAMVSEKHII